ncbi:hypothetical protein, partial [Gemmatimonas sp.]|uniref:hypothetical protein n=1 Tax=Gemmatimonas sp. TaxID=1962908 RepID=UPI003566DAF7
MRTYRAGASIATFTAMDVGRRIAAIALFGVQLLQGVFPAAGVDCERHTVVVAAPVAALAAEVASAHSHHGAPAVVSTDAPMPVPIQHRHAPAACPMA